MRRHRLIEGIILGAITISAPALALKPGEVLKYQCTTAWIEPIDPSTPAALLRSGRVAPTPMSYSYPFTVLADGVDSDGIAHAVIKTNVKAFVRGWSFNEPIEASVMPDGQIVPKYDLTLLKRSGLDENHSMVAPGYSPRTHEESLNFAAASFNLRLGYFNDLALGAGKKAPFKDGDAWRIALADKDEVIDFTYQGMQSLHGHEVAAVRFTTTHTTQTGVAPVTGNFLYDLDRHIVTSAHWVGDQELPSGVRSATVDVALQ